MKMFKLQNNDWVVTFILVLLIAYHDCGVTSIQLNNNDIRNKYHFDTYLGRSTKVVNDKHHHHPRVNTAFSNLYPRRLPFNNRSKKGNKGVKYNYDYKDSQHKATMLKLFINDGGIYRKSRFYDWKLYSSSSKTKPVTLQKNPHDMTECNGEMFQECLHLIVTDFKSASFKKQRRSSADFSNGYDNKTEQRLARTMLENQLKESFALSPSLFQIYCDYNNNSKDRHHESHIDNPSNVEEEKKLLLPIAKMISLVGPYYKPKLLEIIIRHPELFSRSIGSKKLKSCDDQLISTLELTEKEMKKLKKNSPIDLWHRLHRSDIIELSNYLQTNFCFTKNDVKKMVLSRPFILAYSMKKLQNTVNYLQFELNLELNDISMMIKRNPMILACSPTQKIQPLVDFLRDDIGNNDWRRIVTKNSQLFSHSIEKNLRPKTKFIYEILGLQRVSDLTFIVSGFTPVLWLSTELISNKLKYFKEEFQLDEEEMRVLFLTYPQLLGLSIDGNVRPKISYFLSAVVDEGAGLTREELKDLILYQPAVLAYSLEKRIKPRIREMQESFISFSYAPQYLMSLTDCKFNKWLEIQRGTWSIT